MYKNRETLNTYNQPIFQLVNSNSWQINCLEKCHYATVLTNSVILTVYTDITLFITIVAC